MRRLMALASLTALVSCSTVTTQQIPAANYVTTQADGFAYSLPKRNVRLTLTRTMETITDAEKLVIAAQSSKATLKQATAAAEQAGLAKSLIDQLVAHDNFDDLIEKQKSEIRLKQANLGVVLGRAEQVRTEAEEEAEKTSCALHVSLSKLLPSDDGDDGAAPECDPDSEVKYEVKEPKDKLEINILGYVADSRYRLIANFPHAFLRSEAHNISVNSAGLLQSANLKSSDETAKLISSVVALDALGASSLLSDPSASGILDDGSSFDQGDPSKTSTVYILNDAALECMENGDPESPEEKIELTFMCLNLPYPKQEDISDLVNGLIAALSVLVPERETDRLTACQKDPLNYHSPKSQRTDFGPFEHSVIIDPTDETSVGEFNETACRLGSNLRFSTLSDENALSFELSEDASNSRVNGIAYRRLWPVQLRTEELKKIGPIGNKTIETIVRESKEVHLPNAAPIEIISDFGSLFVTRTTGLKFQDGILVGQDITRPSEAAQLGSAVTQIAKAPFELIGSVLKLKVDIAQDQKKFDDTALAIEKARIEQSLDLTEKLLRSDIELEGLAATREDKLALDILKTQNSLQINPLENEGNYLEQLLKNKAAQVKIDQALLQQEIITLNKERSVSVGELESAIAEAKIYKEFLALKNEIKELEEKLGE